jgi:hypothetical protein
MTVTTLPHITFVVSPLPIAGEPIWDAQCQEWCLTDSDGIAYFGATPGACYRQFAEALHTIAQHVRRSLCGSDDLIDYRTNQATRGPHE